MKQYFCVKENRLLWEVSPATYSHTDSYEMAGFGADAIVTYGVDEAGNLVLNRHVVFPTLLKQPLDTHAITAADMENYAIPSLHIDGNAVTEQGVSFSLDGILTVCSSSEQAIINRRFCIAGESLALCEEITVTNRGEKPITAEFTSGGVMDYILGTKGMYRIGAFCRGEKAVLGKEETAVFTVVYSAVIGNADFPALSFAKELEKRRNRLHELETEARLETGNEVLDTMYRFAQWRAGESIFRLDCGLLHSPGGGQYYAASWCNDQIEYAAPWFAFTGDAVALEASVNAFEQYIPFMTDNYAPIPSSVICERNNYWNGAGDRGDAAMYLYGATLLCLTEGTAKTVGKLWDAIVWCGEYCHRKMLPDGTVSSDSDELEGRFPTDGIANLSTSCLAYQGYCQGALLADKQGHFDLGKQYRQWAERIRNGIETRFGATLHGFETYRYSQGVDTLRSWICLPLCFAIGNRLEGTKEALLSPYLWTENGMLTCEIGEENPDATVWDRSTLYAFRGLFAGGQFGKVWDYFLSYCEKRLLGERVPCPVEAYPEGNQRHLSAESALFCRIISEGVLRIKHTENDGFSFVPRLPAGCDCLVLENTTVAGKKVSFRITAQGYTVSVNGKNFTGTELNKEITIAERE